MGPGSGSAASAPATAAPEAPKSDAKPAPVVAPRVEANPPPPSVPVVATMPQAPIPVAASAPAPPAAAAPTLQQLVPQNLLPQNQLGAWSALGLDPSIIAAAIAPTNNNTGGLLAVIDQMRAQVAAEAASKDLLLRQALALEQQRMAQNNANGASADLLEGILKTLVSATQPVAPPPPGRRHRP